jgi:hypothetical protein
MKLICPSIKEDWSEKSPPRRGARRAGWVDLRSNSNKLSTIDSPQ